MLAVIPPPSHASYLDYGRTDYLPKTVQTASFSNRKLWAERNPPVLTTTRYSYSEQVVQNLILELESALTDWRSMINDYLAELRSQIDKKSIISEDVFSSIEKALNTSVQSLRQTGLFITALAPHLRPDFLPSAAVDNEGEISFEWYGRRGARASLIIGANGVLYFVSLFHGMSLKSRLLWSNDIPPIILTELDKIYKDKRA
jgi:hypothetical protein